MPRRLYQRWRSPLRLSLCFAAIGRYNQHVEDSQMRTLLLAAVLVGLATPALAQQQQKSLMPSQLAIQLDDGINLMAKMIDQQAGQLDAQAQQIQTLQTRVKESDE